MKVVASFLFIVFSLAACSNKQTIVVKTPKQTSPLVKAIPPIDFTLPLSNQLFSDFSPCLKNTDSYQTVCWAWLSDFKKWQPNFEQLLKNWRQTNNDQDLVHIASTIHLINQAELLYLHPRTRKQEWQAQAILDRAFLMSQNIQSLYWRQQLMLKTFIGPEQKAEKWHQQLTSRLDNDRFANENFIVFKTNNNAPFENKNKHQKYARDLYKQQQLLVDFDPTNSIKWLEKNKSINSFDLSAINQIVQINQQAPSWYQEYLQQATKETYNPRSIILGLESNLLDPGLAHNLLLEQALFSRANAAVSIAYESFDQPNNVIYFKQKAIQQQPFNLSLLTKDMRSQKLNDIDFLQKYLAYVYPRQLALMSFFDRTESSINTSKILDKKQTLDKSMFVSKEQFESDLYSAISHRQYSLNELQLLASYYSYLNQSHLFMSKDNFKTMLEYFFSEKGHNLKADYIELIDKIFISYQINMHQ